MRSEHWPRGTMTFTNKAAKPLGITMDAWLAADVPRTWVSKKGETPSAFIVRVIRNLEDQGAQIWCYLKNEMEGD